jgi:hypothetical protein
MPRRLQYKGGGYRTTFLKVAQGWQFNAGKRYQLAVDYPGTSGHVLVFDTMGNPKIVAHCSSDEPFPLSTADLRAIRVES